MMTLDAAAKPIRRFSWSPLGNAIAIGSETGALEFWEMSGRAPINRLHQTGHRIINSLCWSANGLEVAVGSTSISVIGASSGARRRGLQGHSTSVWGLAWVQGDGFLVSASQDKSLCVWSLAAGSDSAWVLHGHSGEVRVLAPSPDGNLVASGAEDNTVSVWQDKCLRHVLKAHDAPINSISWSQDGSALFSGSEDTTIVVWDMTTGLASRVLEGHTCAVVFVGVSFKHKLLLSLSLDGTMMAWDLTTFERVASMPVSAPMLRYEHGVDVASLSPAGDVVAIASTNRRQLDLHNLEALLVYARLFENPKTEFYRNAKVMLVGETGVGKSGLSLVLTGQAFVATESTHARKVYSYSDSEHENPDATVERRETLLWDLAGQPDYRLVHQLHLGQVSLALVVFDSRPGAEPLAGVVTWIRCLEQAKRLTFHESYPFRRILVGAREDVGRVTLTPETIQALKAKYGFDDFIRTSAKENWGVSELHHCIRSSIAWEKLPKASSNEIFQQIKSYIIKVKSSGRVLIETDALYGLFLSEFPTISYRSDSQAEFITCIGLLESRDLIHRLSFGGFLLLQPELLDAYAGAIINAAKDDPKGIGAITESEIYDGIFRMPAELRVSDKGSEVILLHATVEELLRYEIAYRDGNILVFPSQFVRESLDLLDPEERDISFRFDGNLINIFATLVVRLAQSGQFKKPDIYRRVAQFEMVDGGAFGVEITDLGAGNGDLVTYFDSLVSETLRNQLNTFVHAHLLRKAVPESVRFLRAYKCINPLCSTHFTEEQLKRCRELGKKTIRCSVCDESSPLIEADCVEISRLVTIQALDAAADKALGGQILHAHLQSRRSVGDFDVWIAYDTVDRALARSLARKLIARGVLPWFDQWDVPPGSDKLTQLAKVIVKIKACVCLIGRRSSAPWSNKAVLGFLEYLTARDRPVVPFLASDSGAHVVGGYSEPPELPKFLRLSRTLDHRNLRSIDVEEVISRLGVRPSTPSSSKGELINCRTDELQRVSRLQERLKSLPPGQSGASLFQVCVREILETVFAGKLVRGQSEVPIDGGSKRVDVVYENVDQSGFFSALGSRFNVRAPYIFVECKNYTADLSTPELDQLAGRLNGRRGNFGLLICREISNQISLLRRLQFYYSGEQKLLVVLQDSDLAVLLRLHSDGKSDLIDDHLAGAVRKVILA